MNSFVEFIVKDLLGQASILIAFIAMLASFCKKNQRAKRRRGRLKRCSVS